MGSTSSMLWATVVMAVVAAALSVFALTRGGDVAAQGWLTGSKTLLRLMPLMVIAFVTAGLVQVLIPKEQIALWLGAKSGWRGIMFGCLAGSITPGGPYITFPIVGALHKAGADVGTLVAFLTGWSLWAIQRLPMEVAFIGPRMALARFAATFLFAPLAGLVARLLFSGFTRTS